MKITIPLPGHWCVRDAPGNVLLLHVVGDLGIFFSYMLVAVCIFMYIRYRPQYKNKFVYLLAAFVFLCGLTHLATIWTLYISPAFFIEGILKDVTFVVSLAAALVAPSSLGRFSEYMHNRADEIQKAALRGVELEHQINELTTAIALRDRSSQVRQEHILQYQMKSVEAIERLSNAQIALTSETRSALTLAREASERILSRESGEQRGPE